MKTSLFFPVLLLFVGIGSICRADVERSLGKSPDQKFELILKAESEQDYGLVELKELATGKIIETDTQQGYRAFGHDDVEAHWKDTSDAFAITLRGTKRTTNSDIYVLHQDQWVKLVMPPYVENILGRQGVINRGRNLNEDFYGFAGKSGFSLVCHVEPDWQEKEKAAKVTSWKPTDEVDWVVSLEWSLDSSSNCVVKDIQPFNEGNLSGIKKEIEKPMEEKSQAK